MAVIHSAVYVDGVRVAEPATLTDTFEALRRTGGVAWIATYQPSEPEMQSLADHFGLHHLAVEDALTAHQRSKLERYGDVTFIVLRPARMADGRVRVGELHLFVGPNFVISARHDDFPDLAEIRHRLEASPSELDMGPMAILYAILDQLVDEYALVVADVADQVDDVEDLLLSEARGASVRIYQLMRDVLALQHAVHPVAAFTEQLTRQLAGEPGSQPLHNHFRDVLDHALHTSNQLDAFRDLLASGLQLHIGLVGQRQNEEMARMTQTALRQSVQAKQISSWAAILFTPTVIAGIYGMNFTRMPELNWAWGYPFALGLMLVATVTLYLVFKRQRWL